jgi:hypothetical protein
LAGQLHHLFEENIESVEHAERRQGHLKNNEIKIQHMEEEEKCFQYMNIG